MVSGNSSSGGNGANLSGLTTDLTRLWLWSWLCLVSTDSRLNVILGPGQKDLKSALKTTKITAGWPLTMKRPKVWFPTTPQSEDFKLIKLKVQKCKNETTLSFQTKKFRDTIFGEECGSWHGEGKERAFLSIIVYDKAGAGEPLPK